MGREQAGGNIGHTERVEERVHGNLGGNNDQTVHPHMGRDVMESQVVTATEVIGIFLRGEGNLWGEEK